MVKAGIAVAAAVAAGGAIFASQAGAASTTTFQVKAGSDVQSTNVMLKVPQGTTCAVVQNELFTGIRTPPILGKKTVYDFKALHWNSSAWNSIGVHPASLGWIRVWAIRTHLSCEHVEKMKLPSSWAAQFKVNAPSGRWPDAFIDDSAAKLR